jgi:probable HAF family extracellular repeat protein
MRHARHHHHYEIEDLGSFPIVKVPISVPAAWQAVTPQDINDAGLVVGWEYFQYGPGGPSGKDVTNEYWQAFSHSEHGGIVQLNQVIPELWQYGGATGVNAAGSIAVTKDWSGGAGQYQAALVVSDKLELPTPLPPPYNAAPASYFTKKINSSGHFVGAALSSLGNASVPFVSDGKTIKSLGNLRGGNQGGAFGINDREEIVGQSSSASAPQLAFLYSERHGLRDLNTLVTSGGGGWVL